MAGLEAMTRLTELRIMVPFPDKQGDLQGLTCLQRLALHYDLKRFDEPPRTTNYPFLFPEAAAITKLRLTVVDEVCDYSLPVV